jgi:Domain of unknown function (DUF4258)
VSSRGLMSNWASRFSSSRSGAPPLIDHANPPKTGDGKLIMSEKRILFSGHARFEMKRRGISRALAEATIRAPGQVVPSEKGREIYQAIVGRRGRLLIRVIVKEAENAYHVVTAYKTSRIKKYWRES